MNLEDLSKRVLAGKIVSSSEIRKLTDSKFVNVIVFQEKVIKEIEKAFQSGEISESEFNVISGQATNLAEIKKVRKLFDSRNATLRQADITPLIQSFSFILRNTSRNTIDGQLRRQSLSKAIALLKIIEELEFKSLKPSENIEDVLKVFNKLDTIGLRTTIDKSISSLQGKENITFKFDDKFQAEAKKLLSVFLANQIKGVVSGNQKSLAFFKSIDIEKISLVSSFTDDIKQVVRKTFKGKSFTKKARSSKESKGKLSNSFKKTESEIKKYNAELKRLRAKLARIKTVGSTINLKKLLNKSLHDQIKVNMGSPFDPPIKLRYQTGRFARSAKVEKVNTRKQAVQVFYTYQHDPYDVFLPGHRLHKPQRNPQVIIGKSIRQLALLILGEKFKVRATSV